MKQLKYSKSLKAPWTGIANDPVQDWTFLLSSLWKDRQPWALNSSLGASCWTGVQMQLHQGWTQTLAPPCDCHNASLLALWENPHHAWARVGQALYNHTGHVTHIRQPNSPQGQSRADPNSCCLSGRVNQQMRLPGQMPVCLGRKQTFAAYLYQNNSEIQVLAKGSSPVPPPLSL